MPNFEMKTNAEKKVAELRIDDVIGDGWFGGVSAKDIVSAIKDAGDVDQIDVYINSPGGSVFEGVSIYNELKNHKARVDVFVRGLAASAASFIAMAGDQITMEIGSMMMIHNSIGVSIGNKETMLDVADRLDKVDNQIAEIYAAKTGKSISDIKEVMQEETWYTAKEAVDAGFADIALKSDGKTENRIQNVLNLDTINKFGYQLPERIAALVSDTKPAPEVAETPTKEAVTMPKEEEKTRAVASLKELKAACEGASPEFLLAQIEQEATVEEAVKAYNIQLRADLAKEKEEREKAQSAKPGVKALDESVKAETETEANPIDQFNAEVAALVRNGMSAHKAHKQVCQKNPDLRAAMVAAVNEGRK